MDLYLFLTLLALITGLPSAILSVVYLKDRWWPPKERKLAPPSQPDEKDSTR